MNINHIINKFSIVEENFGNLNAIPKSWAKLLTRTGYMGGQNSQIVGGELITSFSEITKKAKLLSGWTKPTNSYRYSNSPDASAAKYAGLYITMGDNNIPIGLVGYDDNYEAEKFFFIHPSGKQDTTNKRRPRGQWESYENWSKTAGYLSDNVTSQHIVSYLKDNLNLTPKKGKVKIWYVTIDQERVAKRKQRKELRDDTSDSAFKSNAVEKMIRSKVEGQVISLKSELDSRFTALLKHLNDGNYQLAKSELSMEVLQQLFMDLTSEINQIDDHIYNVERGRRSLRTSSYSNEYDVKRMRETLKKFK